MSCVPVTALGRVSAIIRAAAGLLLCERVAASLLEWNQLAEPWSRAG